MPRRDWKRWIPAALAAALALAAPAAAQQSAAGQPANQQPAAQQQPTANQQQQAAEPRINWLTAEQIERVPVDSYVFHRARVASVKPPDPGSRQPWSIYLQDDTGAMRVIIWTPVWNQIPNNTAVQRGMIIDCYGKVGSFRGQRQLVIEQANWIRMAPIPQPFLESQLATNSFGIDETRYMMTSIGGVTLSALGMNVHLRGEVADFEPSTAANMPNRVRLKDDTGEIPIVYWIDIAEGMAPQQMPEVGQPLEVKGRVTEYAGVIQVRIYSAANIERPDLRPAPAADPGA